MTFLSRTGTTLLALILAPLLSGCSAGEASQRHGGGFELGAEDFDEIMYRKVAISAQFDLNCSPEKMQMTKLAHGVYAVVGCGQRARYVGRDQICFDGNSRKRVERDCVVVLDHLTVLTAEPL